MRPYPSSFFILLSNIYCSPTPGFPMFQFPTLTILLPGDIVPVSNRQRWRRSRKIRPERDAEAGSVLRAFAAGTTPEPLANAECRMQNAEWTSTLPSRSVRQKAMPGPPVTAVTSDGPFCGRKQGGTVGRIGLFTPHP